MEYPHVPLFCLFSLVLFGWGEVFCLFCNRVYRTSVCLLFSCLVVFSWLFCLLGSLCFAFCCFLWLVFRLLVWLFALRVLGLFVCVSVLFGFFVCSFVVFVVFAVFVCVSCLFVLCSVWFVFLLVCPKWLLLFFCAWSVWVVMCSRVGDLHCRACRRPPQYHPECSCSALHHVRKRKDNLTIYLVCDTPKHSLFFRNERHMIRYFEGHSFPTTHPESAIGFVERC